MSLFFSFEKIPDPKQTSLAVRVGDVRQAVFAGWKSLLRVLSEMEPESIQMSLCFYYTPDLSNGVQGRWKVWLRTFDSEKVSDETIITLIKNGPITEYYPINKISEPPKIKWEIFSAVGEVVKRLERIKSYIPKDQNDKVPEYYYVVSAFQPIDANDYMGMDRILSSFREPVYFEITARPIKSLTDASNLYRYISNIAAVNEAQYRETGKAIEDQRAKVGFRRDHLAEELLRENEEFVRNMRLPQLEFSIRLFASNSENARLLTSTLAEHAFAEGKYRVLLATKESPNYNEILESTSKGKILHGWQHEQGIPEQISRLPRMASVNELSGVFRMPVGGAVSPRTIRKNETDPEPLKSIKQTILVGDDIEAGIAPVRESDGTMVSFFDTPSSSTIEHRLTHEMLKKHMFIAGVPGSGKTTAMFNILAQLHRNGIPFLAIEPAKTEYRMLRLLEKHSDPSLKDLGSKLRVFTPGNEAVSPFRFNPMAFPPGLSLDEHINNLMNCFKAAMPMDGPLPALLGKAIEVVYRDYETNGFPFLKDLVEAVKTVMNETKYDSEIRSNIETAIEVRLSPLIRRSMGKVFSYSDVAPTMEDLMENPVVIEMDALDQEQANLLTLFILTSAREYIKTTRHSGAKLTHVLVLEEAHNIVGRVAEDGPADDPRARAAQYISRMLAELRALGEGIIIADQLPSTVAPAVIKNTGIKLANRLTSIDDREELGHTMLLGETEIEELARLQPGEAFFYHEKLYRSRRVKCINSYDFLGLKEPPDNSSLFESIKREVWFSRMAKASIHLEIEDWINNYKIWDKFYDDYYNSLDNLLLDKKIANNIEESKIATQNILLPIETLLETIKESEHQKQIQIILLQANKLSLDESWIKQIVNIQFTCLEIEKKVIKASEYIHNRLN